MLGTRIAALRRQSGMSQAKLAENLCVSASAVGMYEQGRREPSMEQVVAIARLFGVTTDYLLTGELVTEADRTALIRIAESIRMQAEREIVVRRADGTLTKLTTTELAMACAAVLGS